MVNAFTSADPETGQSVRAVDYWLLGRPAGLYRMLSVDVDGVLALPLERLVGAPFRTRGLPWQWASVALVRPDGGRARRRAS